MFFGAGNVLLKHETKEIDKVSGIIKSMPATGTMLLIGGLAIHRVAAILVYLLANLQYFQQVFPGKYNPFGLISAIYKLWYSQAFSITSVKWFSELPKPGIVTGEVSRWTLGAMAIVASFRNCARVYIPRFFYDMIIKVVAVIRWFNEFQYRIHQQRI